MPEIISLINFKGGVAKTASAVNIAADLAKFHDKKTLLVDLDPQSNSSLWLMGVERFERIIDGNRNIYGLFRDHIRGTHNFDFEEACVENVVRKLSYGVYRNPIPNLDLLPATYKMISLEAELIPIDNRHKIMRRALRDAVQDYDYVIIDCPPNVYSVTRNALFWSDHFLIPAIPDFLSNVGLNILARQIRDFLDNTADERSAGQKAECLGVMFTIVRETFREHRLQKTRVESALNDLKNDGVVGREAEILQPDIRNSVKVQEAAGRFLPLCEYKPQAAVTSDYQELATAIKEKVES
jgi:chromosome partitioning protein